MLVNRDFKTEIGTEIQMLHDIFFHQLENCLISSVLNENNNVYLTLCIYSSLNVNSKWIEVQRNCTSDN